MSNILDQIAQVASNATDPGKELRSWALSKVDAISRLDNTEYAQFANRLNEFDVPQSWLKEHLKPAVTEKRKTKTPGTFSTQVMNLLTSLGYSFALNLLDNTVEVNGEQLTDITESVLLTQCIDAGIKSVDSVRHVFTSEAAKNTYHPVKQYLESLQWDGEDHIRKLSAHFKDDHAPIEYKVDERTATAPVFRVWLGKWLIAAVAKVYSEGTVRAQPPMLVLDGAQNLGKSTFVMWLASPVNRFIESDIRPDDDDHRRYLATKWIWEVGELGGTTRKTDRDALKQFLTMHESTFRIPYARHSVTKPALASFVGTVNNEAGFLSDPTGNRRFLCVHLTEIDHSYQQSVDVHQVWAQAYALCKRGETWRLSDNETVKRDEINAGYMKENSIRGWIEKYFDIDPAKRDWLTSTTDVTELLQKKGVTGSTTQIQSQVPAALKEAGLKQHPNERPRKWVGIRPKVHGDNS